MAVKTRAELLAANAALFVSNITGNITPPLEKAYNDHEIDSFPTLSDDNDFTGVQNHTKEVRWHKGVNLASATNVALGVTGNYHHITGAVEIESLSTKQHGTRMLLYFVSNPNLKQSANLLLGGADITVLAGSNAEFISEGSGIWRLIKYNNGAISGTWVPTLTPSGFDSASNVASQYQIVDNFCLFQCYVEGTNSGLVSSGTIDIEPPLGLTAGVTVATVSLRNIGVVALFSDIVVTQGSGVIQIIAEFATPTIGTYEFVISGSFLIA